MGWNTVQVPEGSTLLDGLQDERFYFVHSYAARPQELAQLGALLDDVLDPALRAHVA